MSPAAKAAFSRWPAICLLCRVTRGRGYAPFLGRGWGDESKPLMEKAIFERLERLVRTLAAVVGLTTAVAVPAGFGMVAYWDQIAYRQFQARLAADRLSEYAYIQGPAWRFGKHRLEELISFVALPGDEVCQIVYDQAGRLVFVQGPQPSGP